MVAAAVAAWVSRGRPLLPVGRSLLLPPSSGLLFPESLVSRDGPRKVPRYCDIAIVFQHFTIHQAYIAHIYPVINNSEELNIKILKSTTL